MNQSPIYIWWHYRDGAFHTIMAFLVALIIGCFVVMYLAAEADAEQWEAFSTQHECRVVGQIRGDVSFGVGIAGNGQVSTVITTTSDKTGYACNDGMTYWR